MPNQETTLSGDLGLLETESLRFTGFLSSTEGTGPQNWWAELTGAEPETRNSRPSLGQFQEAGPLNSYGLVLSMNPGRVDWLLTPSQRVGAPPDPKRAGPLAETLPFFVGLMTRWIGNGPEFTRIALGVVVHEPVPSREEAYRRLARYLPAVKVDPEGSSELFYQVNRPRKSLVIDGLTVNRLSKWSVSFSVPFSFSLLSPAQGQFGRVSEGETTCRIELDINTDPMFSGSPRDLSSPRLLEEFVKLAEEIVTVGEIP
jgi:hypothetical protein